ncbi:MAG: transcription antitermination factor NusB [Eubacteriaceae bacterium]|nr:transcription antitermination factor NusB [Eubacteriaceae bacterium]
MKRSEAREKVFRIIFQYEFHDDFESMLARLLIEEALADEQGPKGTQGKYASAALEGILGNLSEIDAIIEEHLKGWSFERLSKHVKALLRLGIYELCYDSDIPDVTAVDEAVTLSHQYCEEKEAVFVNGLLNNVLKKKKSAKGQGVDGKPVT